MSNEIFSAPRDRALDPSRSIGSGPSMGQRKPPKFGGDPGFNGPGSLKPLPKPTVDPGFGRGKVNPPKMGKPSVTAKPMPYTGPIGGAQQDPQPYRGPIGGTKQTLPYYPQG